MLAELSQQHRSQAQRILNACERLKRTTPYAAFAGTLLAIFRAAVFSCERSGSNSVMARTWRRVAEKAKVCLEQCLQNEAVHPDPAGWIELSELGHCAQIADLSARMAVGRGAQANKGDLQELLGDLRNDENQIEALVQKKEVFSYKLDELTKDEEQRLSDPQWPEPNYRLYSESGRCCAKCSARGAYIIYATEYLIRFADNEIDSPPETRHLCVFYQEGYCCDEVEEPLLATVVEGSILGRLFKAEGGQTVFLGNQDSSYRDWLSSNGVTPNEDHPFGFDRRDGEKWVWGPLRRKS